ncbi:MAG: SUMF1/EgtB/PvdO family nonheme iron enzyme [Planctomycetaceae bacterium]|nr:SUMF1/EgtB/PvdO family nonheme iron enzyme [Planctomycetaceae bacterium]
MTDSGNALIRVFVSYNHREYGAVERLVYALKADDLQFWWDRELTPGTPWLSIIDREIKTCQVVLVCIGPEGIGPWQGDEIQIAADLRIRNPSLLVIPVILPGGAGNWTQLPATLHLRHRVEYVRSIDGEPSTTDVLRAAIRGQRLPDHGPPRSLDQSPYPGLASFEGKDELYFRGRDEHIRRLLEKLSRATITGAAGQGVTRFVAVVGASGSGKSSLVRAGVLPRLRGGALPGSADWPVMVFRPAEISVDPVQNLAVAMMNAPGLMPAGTSLGTLVDELRSRDDTLHLHLAAALAGKGADHRALIVIDQFEEVFTVCSDVDAQRSFLDNILRAAATGGGRAIILVTFRADLYSSCALHPRLAQAMSDNQELLGPLTEDHLRDVIEWPARQTDCEIEPGLVDLLVAGMRGQPNALPLLQFTLHELWKRGGGRRLSIENYKRMGELHGALDREAERVFGLLDPVQQRCCETIFLRLIQPGQGHEDTRRRALQHELQGAADDHQAALVVLERFAAARLISSDADSVNSNSAGFIEIAHEALIRGWKRLSGWIDANREALRVRIQLSDAAGEWDSRDRNADLLYHGLRLAEAEDWRRRGATPLTTLEAEFLDASIRERDAESRRKEKQRRREVRFLRAVTALSLSVLVFVGAGVAYAVYARRAAARAESLARVQVGVKGDVAGLVALADESASHRDAVLQWVDEELDHQRPGREPATDADSAAAARLLLRLHLFRLLLLDDVTAPEASRSRDYVCTACPTISSADTLGLCRALRTAGATLAPRFWTDFESMIAASTGSSGRTDSAASLLSTSDETNRQKRIRIVALLAAFDPSSARWSGAAEAILQDLLNESNLADLTHWLQAIRPIQEALQAPLLQRFSTPTHGTGEQHQRMIDIAASLTEANPVIRARLLVDADPRTFERLFDDRLLGASADAIKVFQTLIPAEWPPPPSTIAESSTEARAANEREAKRRANAAVALVRLGRADATVWRLLQQSVDNETRSFLVHRFAQLGANPETLLEQWKEALNLQDRSKARALALALGEFPADAVPDSPSKKALLDDCERLLARDPDPGLHAAIEWLMKKWNRAASAQEIERRLRADYAALNGSEDRERFLARRRGWYVDSMGNAMTIVEKPGIVMIGSPAWERRENQGNKGRESRHPCRIDRRYAIGMKEITVGQFSEFLKELTDTERADFNFDKNYSYSADCPINSLTWYLAARYCNWLSARDGLPRDQFCYADDSGFAPGLVPKEGYLSLAGYRFPTEPEWEYACRAGSHTTRYFGDSEELLEHYARYSTSTAREALRNRGILRFLEVGALKPNDFGLFDPLGNCDELCQEHFVDWTGRTEQDEPRDDREDLTPVGFAGDQRVARGGSLVARPIYVRCANRYTIPPDTRPLQNRNCIGLRVARTLPPAQPATDSVP